MSSKRVGEIRFRVYAQDHEPRHVHGEIGSGEVTVNLRADETLALAERMDCLRGTVSKSEVRKVLEAADSAFDDLVALWDRMHR